MKKLLSLFLALALALAMTSIAMADPAVVEYTFSGIGYRLTEGAVDNVDAGKEVAVGSNITPGWTVYYPIFDDAMNALTDADQVKGVSIKQSWDLGKEYIEGVSIVKKKLKSNSTYYYFVEVKYKAGTSTGVDNISGEINFKKSTATMDGATVSGKAFVAVLGISGTYSFPEADTLTGIDAEETLLYNFSSSGLLYGFDGEQTFDFESGHYFDVDLTGQGKILIYYDEKYNSSVAAAYPYANLDFVNFNGASFNKTGELTILAEEGSYLYALNSDGSLSKIKSEYDEYEEAFKITTRTLGKYVISDTELQLVAASSEAPAGSEAPAEVKPNPGTGAAA